MPITLITKDPNTLTMTVVADFPVPVRRLWDAYADPRQLERFWGPPTHPATFTRHDMVAGGRSEYVLTGPDGEAHNGYWEYLTVEPVESFEVLDGFAHADGTPNSELPSTRAEFSFSATTTGSRVRTTSYFTSLTALEELIAMGMEDGLRAAMGQMDEVLADLESFAAGGATQVQLLDDTQARVSRVIRGSADQVWAAHTDADLMRRWMLGPDGWVMPTCQVAGRVGDTYRYEWEMADGSQRFGFTGELLESTRPHRTVTTERMIGMDGPGTTNEMTLTPVEGGTLLSVVITYPSAELRDTILATGMADGMEASYSRMEDDILATV